MLRLHCCVSFSLVAASRGSDSACDTGLLTAVLLLCTQALGVWALGDAARGLRASRSPALEHRLGSCGSCAKKISGMRDLPGPCIEPLSPALAGRFLPTDPGGLNYGFERSLYAELSPLLHHGLLASGIHTFHFQPFSLFLQAEMTVRFFCLSSSTLCSVQPGNLLRGQAPFFQGPNAPLFLPTSGSVFSNSSLSSRICRGATQGV